MGLSLRKDDPHKSRSVNNVLASWGAHRGICCLPPLSRILFALFPINFQRRDTICVRLCARMTRTNRDVQTYFRGTVLAQLGMGFSGFLGSSLHWFLLIFKGWKERFLDGASLRENGTHKSRSVNICCEGPSGLSLDVVFSSN